ncbi:MAG: pyrroline-5-carboxylate reductase [Candidatus Tectomicrobia bacterium]|nr:pyrroline-5-carboxylate reductase [Candidatus Tectomicrobia bacterium]
MASSRLAVIGGGNMGEALAKGMVSARYAAAAALIIAEPVEARARYLRETHGFQVVPAAAEAAAEAEKVIFAVKPQVLGAVLSSLKGVIGPNHLLISIVAGATTRRFTEAFGEVTRIIRVMPNTPALLGMGAAGLSAGGAAAAGDLAEAKRMLESVGKAVEVPEALMDAVTGLSGSGPAYVFVFIEALADGGVRVGLPRDQATLLAAQTVLGAAKMLLETEEHPGRLKDMVASPGGTTIAGLHALERGGFRSAVIDAVLAATKRSAELGRGESGISS